jgi:hypothetical protein
MLTLVIFLLAVYGLANAIAMLKIGVYFFGDPVDELVLSGGTRIAWRSLAETGSQIGIEDQNGRQVTFEKTDVKRILRRKFLGRIPYVGEMFYCPACLSFWIGMAASAWVISPAFQVCPVAWKAVLLDGLMACATSWLLHAAAVRMTRGAEDAQEVP